MRFLTSKNLADGLVLTLLGLCHISDASPINATRTETSLEERCTVNKAPGGIDKFVAYYYEYVQIIPGTSGCPGCSGASFSDTFWGIAPEAWYDSGCSPLVSSHGNPAKPVHTGFPTTIKDPADTFTLDGLGVCDQGIQTWTKQCDGSWNVASPGGGTANCIMDETDNIGTCAYTVADSGVSGAVNRVFTCTGNICIPGQF